MPTPPKPPKRTSEELRKSLHKRERRERGALEFRDDATAPTIRMFIPYESQSVDMGFTELIAPGAFTRSIKMGQSSQRADVVALWNHDSGRPLARQANGTLAFDDTDQGLTAVATLNPVLDEHRDAVEMVRSGLVRGSSFGFETVRDEWEYDSDGDATRTLLEVRLFDVSPVTYPAYPASDAEARSLTQAADALGLDGKAVLATLQAVKDGAVPLERRAALVGLIATLTALVPAEPVPDDYWEKRLATRERLMIGKVGNGPEDQCRKVVA